MKINNDIAIDEADIEERFIRASGPGGQNVNKVASAVELRFNLAASQALGVRARDRLAQLAGRRLSEDGILVIRADRFRTQERNRADARDRLATLIRSALIEPKRRIATKPSKGSRVRRMEHKARRSSVKSMRRVKPGVD